MARFRKIFLACPVSLTAAMTLVAGLPRLECRCPDGHVKPVCLSLFIGSSGCCCGGSCCVARGESGCCAADKTAPAKSRTCPHCSKPAKVVNAAREGPCFQSSPCTRNPARGQIQTVSPNRTSIIPDEAPQGAVPATLKVFAGLRSPAAHPECRQNHCPSPPFDLV